MTMNNSKLKSIEFGMLENLDNYEIKADFPIVLRKSGNNEYISQKTFENIENLIFDEFGYVRDYAFNLLVETKDNAYPLTVCLLKNGIMLNYYVKRIYEDSEYTNLSYYNHVGNSVEYNIKNTKKYF